MTNHAVGSVDGLRRFPVKSMRGEELEEAELTTGGLVGDRAYALIDVGDAGQFPCAGVYAVRGAVGTIRIGDRVCLT